MRGARTRRSDLGRIKRQQDFIERTAKAVIERVQSDPFVASELIDAASRAMRMDPGLDPVKAAGTLRKAFSTGVNKYQLPVSRRDQGRQRRARARRRRRADPRLLPRRRPAPAGRRGLTTDRRSRSVGNPVKRPEPMKALILAGGAGTRLRPITHTRAKQLVPVANTPILHYGIHSMVAAGITELGVIVGDTRDEVMAGLGDGSQFGASITYIPQDEPLGLAHCVLIAREFLGDDDFVMYLGDNLLEQDLAAFVDAFAAARARRRPAVGPDPAQAGPRPAPIRHRQRSTTPATSSTSSRSRPTRRRTSPSSACTCSIRSIHDAVAAIDPSERGELEITDAIQWLIDHGHVVRMEILTGWWIDTGKLTPLLEANRLILERIETRHRRSVDDDSVIDGRVIVEAGAQIVNSTIRGPVAIGADGDRSSTASSARSARSAPDARSATPRSSTR